jgi:hypothetical protein
VRLPRRLVVQRCAHDRLDLLRRNLRLTTPPRPNDPEIRQPGLRESLAPSPNSDHRHPQPFSDPRVRLTSRSQQQRLRSPHLLVRRTARTRQHLQRRPLSIRQLQRRGRTIHRTSVPQPDSQMRDATVEAAQTPLTTRDQLALTSDEDAAPATPPAHGATRAAQHPSQTPNDDHPQPTPTTTQTPSRRKKEPSPDTPKPRPQQRFKPVTVLLEPFTARRKETYSPSTYPPSRAGTPACWGARSYRPASCARNAVNCSIVRR